MREDAEDRRAHGLRTAVELVDETRASLALNPGAELALEALAYRVAAATGG